MFRTDADVHEPERRTFDYVRRTLESSLYLLHYDRVFVAGPEVIEAGTVYPIPYYFDPVTNQKMKAWHGGNLIIDHMCLGSLQVANVTATVWAAAVDLSPVILSTMVCNLDLPVLPPPVKLKRFEAELKNVDLRPYDALGISYEIDAAPSPQFHFSTTLIWRPNGR